MLSGHRALLVHPGIYDDLAPRAFPPWGLLCIGEVLRRRGGEVRVLDLNGVDAADAVRREVEDFAPTVLGITGKMGLAARRMRRVVAAARQARPSLPIGVGGPLTASYPDPQHALWKGVDALFLGDGEDAFADWIARGCPGDHRSDPGEAADLDAVGIPTWWEGLAEYVHPAEEWPNMDVPAIHVASARGCTNRCTFCYLHTQAPGIRFRFVSARRLLDDLNAMYRRFGASGFYFVDDCFIDAPRRRVGELCRLLETLGSPYRFGCDVQLFELEDPDLLESMYSAGFRCLYVGVEAASASVRKRLGKVAVREDVAATLGRALDLGFMIRASIGIGWPGETEAEMVRTLELIDAEPRLVFDGYRYKPLPGVPLTRFWSRRSLRPARLPEAVEAAFEDYSEYNSNYSEISDSRFEALWEELVERRDERYDRLLGGAAAAAAEG